jgi:hypothetical protein
LTETDRRKDSPVSGGKLQVTFAVRASEKDLPLGRPIALVFVATDGDLRKLTFLTPCGADDFARKAWYWHPGRLQAAIAEEMTAVIQYGVWERLLMTEGIQDEIPGAWRAD